MTSFFGSKTFGFALGAAIVRLTLVTANIHLSLGGMLFTMNGLGYLGLAALYVVGAAAPTAMIQRFSWFPRIALMGYAALTIAGYLVIGPHFTLGWIAKGVEVALIVLVTVRHLPGLRQPQGLRPSCARLGRPGPSGAVPPDRRLTQIPQAPSGSSGRGVSAV